MSCFRVLSKPRCGRVWVHFAVVVLVLFGSVTDTPLMGQESGDLPAAEASSEGEQVAGEQETGEQGTGEQETGEAAEEMEGEGESKPAAETEGSGDAPSENSSGEQPEGGQPPAKEPEAEVKAEPAADPEWVAKGVWTLPPTEGPVAMDFSLVGEYVGELKSAAPQDAAADTEETSEGEQADAAKSDTDESDTEESDAAAAAKSPENNRLGVQIRTLGNGQFEARAYAGGLPGQEGFENKKPMVLIGRRSGETLVLSGGPWAMFAGPEQCKIIDADGTTLALLPRTERESPTLGATPPEGAMVLFDGTDTSAFLKATMTDDNLLAQGADINFMLGDFDLHMEFRIPHMPKQTDQKRGNSGLYLQSRYECQVLDSFGDANVFNGLGALYRFKTPKMNMAFPPLKWQTYDIRFTSARYGADGTKLRNARVTSWINGVKVQDDEELPGPTGAGQPESPTLLPTKIQDHGDPVRFRNIWVIDRGLAGGVEFPQLAKPSQGE